MEHATRTFSARELERKRRGGLYSTIGRSEVGLIEADIDELTATRTGRGDVLAAAKHAVVTKILAKHSDGVLAGLLGSGKMTTLPTVSPVCHHEPAGSRPETAGRAGCPRPSTPSCPENSRSPLSPSAMGYSTRRGRSNGRGLIATAVRPEEGLEMSKRQRIFGTDERQHRENLGENLRRLRALLGESKSKGEAQRVKSSSIFSVNELRAIGAAKRQRQQSPTAVGSADALSGGMGPHEAEVDQGGLQQEARAEATAQQEGIAAELAVDGNVLLRNLAQALFSSMQRRIQKEFLLLGWQKWKVKPLVWYILSDSRIGILKKIDKELEWVNFVHH